MPLTDEDKTEIAEMLTALLAEKAEQAAAEKPSAAQAKAAAKAAKAAEERVAALEAKLAEIVAAKAEAEQNEQAEQAGAKTNAAAQTKAAGGDDPRLNALQREMAAIKASNAKLEAEIQAKEAAMKAKERDASLASALGRHGIEGTRGRAVASLLRDQVAWDEDGSGLVMTVNDVALPLDKAIEAWVATDEGKEFLPAQRTNTVKTGPVGAAQAGRGKAPPPSAQALLEAVLKTDF